MPRRSSPNNKKSESAPISPQPKKKRRSKSSTGPAEIAVLSADIAPQSPDIALLPARKPRRRVRKAPSAAVATGHSEIFDTADQPTMLLQQPALLDSEQPAINENAPVAPAPSVPVHPHPAEQHPSASGFEVSRFPEIDVAAVRAMVSAAASAAMAAASRWAHASHAWLLPRLHRLRQIDLRTPTEKVLRTTAVVARTTSRYFHGLSDRLLLPVARRLGRINPRVAVACVSFAAFGLLLTQVSPEDQATNVTRIAAVVSAKAAVLQALPAQPQHEKSKMGSAVDARMIDAPSRISSSCEKQAWPYVTASCLTVADRVPHGSPSEVVADHAATPDVVATSEPRAIPASTTNAQAMITPAIPVSVEDEKPSPHDVARRRHHEGRHHHARRRHVPRASGVSQDMALARPWSSNTPW